MNYKKRKIIKIILSSSVLSVTLFLIILIPCLMLMDFFGANITDDYVENNIEYASKYKEILNIELKKGNGYVPLTRILYFYLENDKLSFKKIYEDNLDKETNKLLPISKVCKINNYSVLGVCNKENLNYSNQIDEEQNKPFVSPINLNESTITSIFMEERIIFDKSDVHPAWDFASPNNTPVYSVCDGRVKRKSFTQKENVLNEKVSAGNYIYLECDIDENFKYEVMYAHLYPFSSKVEVGDKVSAGQQIAEVGTTGYSTGPHLHYQVKLDNKNIDGMSLIDFSLDKFKPILPSLN